ncbi:tankyrase-1-like [Trichogramma pretiosum]|uniref:tankyrase-1-like n=1 Tax=Trichogramma pretiosum TaxID=7493 RepID=UPI000C719E32|nr:tankyrase-1-like [Trichogramma pretiosum]
MAEDNQNCLKKLKILREEVCWEVEEARHEILDRFEHLIRNGTGKLPNLRDTFQPEEIDWLLIIDAFNKVKTSGVPLIDFVIRTGYKDEPELDKDGKPLFNRTTPIHRAAKTLKPSIKETISKLFEIYNKFDVNYIDESGLTHFKIACMSNCYEVVEKFLELNKSLAQNLVDPPLLFALYDNPLTTLVGLLLRSGANPNVADAEGLTPLHIIGENDNIFGDKVAKLFFKICDELCQPVQVNARDKKGWTPLHMSISKGNEKLTRFLLNKGADLNLVTDDGLNPLHIVCKSDDMFLYYRKDMVSLIFEVNNDKHQLVNAVDKLGRTPLHWAVANLLSDIVDVILDHGADLSDFVFPTEDYFGQRHTRKYTLQMVVFPTMSIVESLKKKGYILDQNAALMIMKFFAKNGLMIDESVDITPA